VRILHTSDWHIGRSLFDYPLLEEQRFFFQQLYQIIEERQVDAVVVAGDIYDRSAPSAEAVSLLNEVLDHLIHHCKVTVLAIAGNHDSPRRIAYGNTLFQHFHLYMEGLCQKEIKKVTLQDQYGPIHFFLLPYFISQEVRALFGNKAIDTSTKAFEALMEENRWNMDSSQRNVLVAHGFFMKTKCPQAFSLSQSEVAVGASDLTDISSAADFDYIALGHLHGPQRAGGETCRYSGSPLKYSVSEVQQEKVVLLVDIGEKGNVEVLPIPLRPLRDLQVLTGTMEQLLAGDTDDFVYANITDTSAVLHAMSQLRARYPHILGLSFAAQASAPAQELDIPLEKLPLDETFQRFYSHITKEDIPPARQQIVEELCNELEKNRI